MKFRIERKRSPALSNYKQDEIEVAYEFSKKAMEELPEMVKAVILYKKKREQNAYLDKIDLLVIIDDVGMVLKQELVEAYRLITEKVMNKVSPRLELVTMKLTAFWEQVRNGDPLIINTLREGVALMDSGFFEPMQELLRQGRIRPSEESINTYYARAPMSLQNSRWHVSQAMIDLYWAAIDASHAALIKFGELPPTPAHVPDYLNELAKKKLINKKHVEVMKNLYALSKRITRKEIAEIKGEQYDRCRKDTLALIEEMRKVVESSSQKV